MPSLIPFLNHPLELWHKSPTQRRTQVAAFFRTDLELCRRNFFALQLMRRVLATCKHVMKASFAPLRTLQHAGLKVSSRARGRKEKPSFGGVKRGEDTAIALREPGIQAFTTLGLVKPRSPQKSKEGCLLVSKMKRTATLALTMLRSEGAKTNH